MRTLTVSPPAPRPMEHRWGERVALDCPVRLDLRDGSGVEGRLRNASISGAWIETGEKLPWYAMVNVIVAAGTGPRRRTIELPASVVRMAPEGIAVEWRDMAVPTLMEIHCSLHTFQPATWAMGDMNYDGIFTPQELADLVAFLKAAK